MLSVIIVNFNTAHLLRKCIESVRQHAPAGTEIIVHDNGSSDGSAEFIARNFADVRLIASSHNLGFVGGNNAAAQVAQGGHLLLLNSDTIVRNSLQPMVDLLNRDASVWAVGCKLIYADGTQQESIGRPMHPVRLALSWSPLAHLTAALRRSVPAKSPLYAALDADCVWVSGACLLTPTERWRQLGGLDRRYFMYMEDADYCRRIRQQGGQVRYTAATVVTHLEGAGRPWIGRRAVLNTAVSYTIYVRKFYGLPGRIVLGALLPPVLWLRAAAHALLHLAGKDAHGGEKAAAYGLAGLIAVVGRPANTKY